MSLSHWITQLLEVALALLAAPLFLGWVNQCRAWLQNRSAPGLLLPYRGIRKLFHKEAVIAHGASPLFRLAPYVVFGAMVLAAAIIPTLAKSVKAGERVVVNGLVKYQACDDRMCYPATTAPVSWALMVKAPIAR